MSETAKDLTLILCNPAACEHTWDGPEVPVLGDSSRPMGYTTTCSKCGARCIDVHLWTLP